MFEFKYYLTDEDYFLFNKYHLLNDPNGKKTLLLVRLVVPFILLMFALVFWVLGAERELIFFELALMVVISVVFIVFSKKLLLKSVRKNLIKLKKQGKLIYEGEVTLRFENDIMIETTSDTESKKNYSLIEKIAVTEEAIYIYLGAIVAQILPATIFSDEEQKKEFLEFINEKFRESRKN